MAMSFDEICNLKKNDVIWEKWLRVTLTTDPVVARHQILGEDYTYVTFFARVGETTTEYRFTKELMHYAPHLYREKMYDHFV